MNPVIWVHDECLNPQSAAFLKYPHAPAVFVWDDAMLAEERWALKRIAFVYECLLEMPVTILRGDPAREVSAFASQQSAHRIVTSDFADPRLRRIAENLPNLEIISEPEFICWRGKLDLRRFSRYWQRVQSLVTQADEQ